MPSSSRIVNRIVVGLGALVVARFAINVLRHHERRSVKAVDREATRAWEGEGGSVTGVNMPQPSLPTSPPVMGGAAKPLPAQ
jgi:hypothetical protein